MRPPLGFLNGLVLLGILVFSRNSLFVRLVRRVGVLPGRTLPWLFPASLSSLPWSWLPACSLTSCGRTGLSLVHIFRPRIGCLGALRLSRRRLLLAGIVCQ